MAFFSKNATPTSVTNKAIKGLVVAPGGVYAPVIPTSGRLNSVSFDQHRVENGSGCAVTDPNNIRTYLSLIHI